MSEKITFKELVELISDQSNQSQSSTNSFIHELVEIIESGLRRNGSVSISGFGKFELRWMNERPGVHPQTGEEITIPGQNKVVFKPYKALRENVNLPFAGLDSKIIGDQPDTPKSKTEKVPLATATSVASTAGPVTIDDLLIEKDNPRFPAAKSSESKELKEAVTEPKTPVPLLPNEEKMARDVQEKGTFKWSYAAAVVIILAAFIILFFMTQRIGEDTTPVTTDQPEQVLTPIEPIIEPDEQVAEDETPPPEETADEQTSFETAEYSVQDGETLWAIAESQFGNPYLWPLIYYLNRDLLENPNQLLSDSEIDIPSISDPDNLNEFEREQIALGYFSLYEWNRANNPDEARYFLWAVGVFSPDLLDQPPSQVDPDDLEFARNR
jgi:nucleoid DNA-binding protein